MALAALRPGKPLATLSILWLALSAQPAVDVRYRRAVLAGMVLSLVGDVCLMLPGDRFVPGLAAFLLAHLCYVVAFAPGSAAKARVVAFLSLVAVAAANLATLLPRIEPALKIPVLAYVVGLAAMAGFALARAWTPALTGSIPRSARFAAKGAMFFVLSDSLLAWDRFAGNVPVPSLLWCCPATGWRSGASRGRCSKAEPGARLRAEPLPVFVLSCAVSAFIEATGRLRCQSLEPPESVQAALDIGLDKLHS